MNNPFKKHEANAVGKVVTTDSVPAMLPTYGKAIPNFHPATYKLAEQSGLSEVYNRCTEQFDPLIETNIDKFSNGDEFDPFIEKQIEHETAFHKKEVAIHHEICEKIARAAKTRTFILQEYKNTLENEIDELHQKLEPLKEVRKQSSLKIGKIDISWGIIATMIFCLFDTIVNFDMIDPIVEGRLSMTIVLLIIMAIASDVSMAVFADCRNKEAEENDRDRKVISYACLILFALSIIASIVMRMGSLDLIYEGREIGIAQIAAAAIASIATAATGLLSFAFSLNKTGAKAQLKKELETQLAAKEILLNNTKAELSELEGFNPFELDDELRKAAEQNLNALRTNLKLHARKLMLDKKKNPGFCQSICENSKKLVADSEDKLTSNIVSLDAAG